VGLQGYLHILLYGEPGEEGKGLKDNGSMRVDPSQDLATVEHLAQRGTLQANNDAQQGALAAARRPQQRHKFPTGEGQIDILNRGKLARAAIVNLADAF